jgi:hypothetical protein
MTRSLNSKRLNSKRAKYVNGAKNPRDNTRFRFFFEKPYSRPRETATFFLKKRYWRQPVSMLGNGPYM